MNSVSGVFLAAVLFFSSPHGALALDVDPEVTEEIRSAVGSYVDLSESRWRALWANALQAGAAPLSAEQARWLNQTARAEHWPTEALRAVFELVGQLGIAGEDRQEVTRAFAVLAFERSTARSHPESSRSLIMAAISPMALLHSVGMLQHKPPLFDTQTS